MAQLKQETPFSLLLFADSPTAPGSHANPEQRQALHTLHRARRSVVPHPTRSHFLKSYSLLSVESTTSGFGGSALRTRSLLFCTLETREGRKTDTRPG